MNNDVLRTIITDLNAQRGSGTSMVASHCVPWRADGLQITLSIAAGACPSLTSRLLTRETGTAAQIKCRV